MNKGIVNRIIALFMCVLLFLQCTPFNVYGQEIGMHDNDISSEVEGKSDDSNDIFETNVYESIDDIEATFKDNSETVNNDFAEDDENAEISISENGIRGTISGNYIYTSDTSISATAVAIYYELTDEDGYTFYDGSATASVKNRNTVEYEFAFNGLSGKRKYILKMYCEANGTEFGYKEISDVTTTYDEDYTFRAIPVSDKGKLRFDFQLSDLITKSTDVFFWVRNESEKRYTLYLKPNFTFKSLKPSVTLSGEAYNGMNTYYDINFDGKTSIGSYTITSDYIVKLNNNVVSKKGLGYFDCFYSVELGGSPISAATSGTYTANAYFFKKDEDISKKLPFDSIKLAKDEKNPTNSYKGVMCNNQNTKLEQDTDYYLEFELFDKNKNCVYRSLVPFKTDKFVEYSGKIISEPAIDSVTINLTAPSGLEIDNKYYKGNQKARIYIAKKDEEYPLNSVVDVDLSYFDGNFVAEGILIDRASKSAQAIGLEEDTEYKIQAVFDCDGSIIASTQFKTLKEPREIVIEGTKVLYGGFDVDLTVHNPDGSLTEASDLYVTYRVKGDLVWQNLKKPELVDKKKKLYRFSAPVDMQANGPGSIIEYKACFSNRSLYSIDVGIVTGEIEVPEDDREIKVYSERTYIDAHAINIGLTGMESYSSYIVLMAKVNDGEYERNSVWSLKDGSNRDMKVCVYTDRYKAGDEVEYMLGYVDSREDTRNPAKLYKVKSGSFTVLPDNRSVEIFDSTAFTDSITLRGKITGDGRMMDYDYVKVFYKVKGEAIPYESKVVTVLPEQMSFDVELTGLEDNSPYEYVIGIAKGSNAYIGELQNPYKGVINTQTAESRIVLKVSDVQPLYVVGGYNVAGNTVEILYSDVAKNANKLAFTTVSNMKGVRYSTTDKNVATITQKGVMTVKGPGIAAITAKKGKMQGQLTIKVIDYKPLLVDKKVTVVQGTSDIHNKLELVEQNGSVITDYELVGATGGTLKLIKEGSSFEIKASDYKESKWENVNIVLKSTKTDKISGNSARSGDDTKTDVYNLDVFVNVKSPAKSAFDIKQGKVPNVFYCGELAQDATFTFKSKNFRIEEIKAKSSKELFQVKKYDKSTGKLYLTPEALTSATLKKYINEEGEDIKIYYNNFVPVTFVVKCFGYDEFEITQNVEIEFSRPEIKIDEAIIPASDREAVVSIYQGRNKLDAAKMRLRFDTGIYEKESVTRTALAAYYDQVRVRISNDLSGFYYYNVSSYQWTDKVKAIGKVKILLDTEINQLQTRTREKTVIVNTSDGYNTAATFNVYVVGNEKLKAKVTPVVNDERFSIVQTRNQGEFMVKGAKNASGTVTVKLDASYKNSAIKGTSVKIKLVNKQPDVVLKRKGKLNIANRNESFVELTPKVLNVDKSVSVSANTILTSIVTVDGEAFNDRCFKSEIVDGKIIIKAKPGYKMYPNRDYKLSMKLELSNAMVLKKDVVIRPISKLPKVKAVIVNKNMYKTNRNILGEYMLDLPEGYEISGITVAKPTNSSIYHEEMEATYDSKTGKAYLQFKKYGARLTSLKNHNVKCELIIKGADGKKNATVKLPIFIR